MVCGDDGDVKKAAIYPPRATNSLPLWTSLVALNSTIQQVFSVPVMIGAVVMMMMIIFQAMIIDITRAAGMVSF